MDYCTNCGSAMEPSQKFCSVCGQSKQRPQQQHIGLPPIPETHTTLPSVPSEPQFQAAHNGKIIVNHLPLKTKTATYSCIIFVLALVFLHFVISTSFNLLSLVSEVRDYDSISSSSSFIERIIGTNNLQNLIMMICYIFFCIGFKSGLSNNPNFEDHRFGSLTVAPILLVLSLLFSNFFPMMMQTTSTSIVVMQVLGGMAMLAGFICVLIAASTFSSTYSGNLGDWGKCVIFSIVLTVVSVAVSMVVFSKDGVGSSAFVSFFAFLTLIANMANAFLMFLAAYITYPKE